tara:strand:+ start:513 stop:1298 length:786 start_codon:yes stop_codon:yes gene_type:complete
MGFKLPGKSITSGTSAHSSALKMKAEENAASALKQTINGVNQKTSLSGKISALGNTLLGDGSYAENKAGERAAGNVSDATKKANAIATEEKTKKKETSSKKPYVKKGGKSTGNMKDYALNSQARRDEYDARGWAHDKTTEVAATTTKTKPKNRIDQAVQEGEDKKVKIADKATKLTGEVAENVSKKTTKITRRGAKKEFGKGSKEHLAAKQAHLVAKEADRQGKEGGRKQGLFRKLSSKINKKRQAKNQAKINAANAEDNA